MWAEDVSKAASVRGPLEPDASSEKGEITLSVSTTAIRVEVPEWLRGRYAEFHARGANVDVLFGDDEVDVIYNQASTVTSEEITLHANSGRPLDDGQTKSWVVPLNATHMAADASAAGTLHIGLASERMEK